MKQRWAVLCLAAFLPCAPAWACVGPRAEAMIQRARWGGWGLALATWVLVVVATWNGRRRGIGRGPLAAGWVLALVHPGFWLDPGGPDCGASRLEGGLLCAAMGVALLLWSAWRPAEDSPVD